jgi:hypothetical protein
MWRFTTPESSSNVGAEPREPWTLGEDADEASAESVEPLGGTLGVAGGGGRELVRCAAARAMSASETLFSGVFSCDSDIFGSPASTAGETPHCSG